MNYPLSELLAKFDQNLDDHPDSSATRERARLRIVLVGSANRIVQTIRQLHSLGFADISDWSPLLALPNSDELFSLLTRSR